MSLSASTSSGYPHPLDQLSVQELAKCVKVLKNYHKGHILHIKGIENEEPPKKIMTKWLESQRSGQPIAPPPRIAYGIYYVMDERRACEIWIDVASGEVVRFSEIKSPEHPPVDQNEIDDYEAFVKASPLYHEALKKAGITGKAADAIAGDGWMYGCEEEGAVPRYMMYLLYSRDPNNQHPESNIYAFPVPFVPVVDVFEKKVVRIDWVATGGDDDDGDSINYNTRKEGANSMAHLKPSEYFPGLVPEPYSTDLKPYNVIQPDGPSFTIEDGSLVKWQGWNFRVGFNPREGMVIHDIYYKDRSTFYRLSVSEMVVPYADPRPPFSKRMAFDFGDCGGGRSANELTLGCDCLGVIKYFSGNLVEPNGEVVVRKNVICMHEQDDGILWKHTNYRTNVPTVVRRRILILQTILTVGNYEYIFAWQFDQAGGINMQIRATGIVSTQLIDEGKKSKWGNIVAPGVLASSHQHIFSLRIDPAVDGHKNTVVACETKRAPWDEHNPSGQGFYNVTTPVETSCAFDADVMSNKYVKIVNENKINPISGKPVGYKLFPCVTALLMATPGSIPHKRAQFATHHFWVTKHKDQEYYAGGVWTNQSSKEIGGLKEAIDRKENVRNDDVILWHSFGLTHHPRVEDFPVMPAEMLNVALHPNDFFTQNPSMDLPPSNQHFNRSVEVMENRCCHKM